MPSPQPPPDYTKKGKRTTLSPMNEREKLANYFYILFSSFPSVIINYVIFYQYICNIFIILFNPPHSKFVTNFHKTYRRGSQLPTHSQNFPYDDPFIYSENMKNIFSLQLFFPSASLFVMIQQR